jgi:predicted metal-dependent HD superfamily phosphohydrolase
MEISYELLWETSLYLQSYLKQYLPKDEEIHNYQAAVKIVQICDLISANTDLGNRDRMKILLAAWFQYTGYCSNPADYETASSELASRYFSEKGLAPDLVQEIKQYILATRYPQLPVTLEAQVLCDAEKSWLADKSFPWTLEQMGKKKEISDKEWLEENIQMMEYHIYFTPFARKMFDKQKEKNKAFLQDKLAILSNPHRETQVSLTPQADSPESGFTLADDIRLDRGVESLFRNTSRNQMHLIRSADYKANLIISINSIIISVILSVLVIRLDANKYLELPTLLLILTSLATILIAISATRPKLNMGLKDQEQLREAGDNLLYFGNFYKMPFEEYKKIIKETIVNRSDLYESLTKDIYHQGILLAKKFKYINLSYTVFIAGLVLSILAFILSFLLHHPISE